MTDELESISIASVVAIEAAQDLERLEHVRALYTGDKGPVASYLARAQRLPAAEQDATRQAAAEVLRDIEAAAVKRRAELEQRG